MKTEEERLSKLLKVCQKLEVWPKLTRDPQRLRRELNIWAALHHKHIVQLNGYIVKLDTCEVALVSPYYKYGPVRQYLSRHPARCLKGEILHKALHRT